MPYFFILKRSVYNSKLSSIIHERITTETYDPTRGKTIRDSKEFQEVIKNMWSSLIINLANSTEIQKCVQVVSWNNSR